MIDLTYTVEAFITAEGKSPVREALMDMAEYSPKLRDGMRGAIIKIQRGSSHGGNLTHHVAPRLLALTVHHDKRTGVIFFTFRPERKIILLNGVTHKKGDEMPIQEIKKAKRLLKEVEA